MEANEPEPDVIAHAALVSCWAKSKKPERARQLLEERQSKDVSPNAITYSTWAWACEKSGDGAEIQEFEAEEAECDKRADVNAKNDSGGPQSSRCRPRWVAYMVDATLAPPEALRGEDHPVCARQHLRL